MHENLTFLQEEALGLSVEKKLTGNRQNSWSNMERSRVTVGVAAAARSQ